MKKKTFKPIDLIIMLVLIGLLIAMAVFTVTRESSHQKIVLIKITKGGGISAGSHLNTNCYIYENSTTVDISKTGFNETTGKSTNTTVSKDIDQSSIDDFKNALENYISKKVEINVDFYMNNHYAIEYNGASIMVPDPQIASHLGFDANQYTFYHTIESFINNLEN